MPFSAALICSCVTGSSSAISTCTLDFAFQLRQGGGYVVAQIGHEPRREFQGVLACRLLDLGEVLRERASTDRRSRRFERVGSAFNGVPFSRAHRGRERLEALGRATGKHAENT